MDPPWIHIKGRGRGRTAPSRGNYGSYGTRSSQGSSYRSESNSPVIQTGRKTLINKRTSSQEESSYSSQQLVSLEDIPKYSPLYAHMQAYLEGKKQKDTFVSIIKEDSDDIKSYEKLQKREMIFLLENSDLQRKDEPWKIFQRYLVNGLYFPGESYKTRSYYEEILINTRSVEFQHFSSTGNNPYEKGYNFSKIIIKHIIYVEDWGMSTMKERHISINNARMNFTYWNYIRAFDIVLYYNNDKHKHTWFVKVCAMIFAGNIPNWFINWWSYHGLSVKILPEPFLNLYKEWAKVSSDLNRLYQEDHVTWIKQIDQIYFFIEFSIPWIHKWAPEVGFNEENIPCLYRTYFNNFWDKLLKQDLKNKQLIGQELMDTTKEKIVDYKTILPDNIVKDNSVRHIARKISFQDGDKEQIIQDYLEEVRKNLLQTITQIDKSDTSMRSETSNDVEDSQRAESEHMLSATELQDAKDFLQQMRALDKGKKTKET
ncbi:hypothetical protein R3W88_033786 [Solanum pinnatisectum]|uniref:Uncharacterized protein n=1 Tax=Solanum pinnatisectum TaxID=50273 RepID=A0AAV9K1U0_9SOLN|nr:hypothetical protein R3W88_033786 [Solanum pinnatisectum]